MRHDTIRELAEIFVEEEISNFKSVCSRGGLNPMELLDRTVSGRQYCFVSMNGDVSEAFIKNNGPARFRPTNPELDSFIKQVNKAMNLWIAQQEEVCMAA